MTKKKEEDKDTYSYKGWLQSDVFMKRAFAILGYNLAAMAVFYIGLGIIFAAVTLLF